MGYASGNALGLYISIPFCRSKCTYCNFASGVYPAAEHARYVERVIEDLVRAKSRTESKSAEHLPKGVDTIYLGGGTPSLLEPDLLARLFTAIRAEFAVDRDAEITMECAPGQIADETLAAMTACGVNRVSLGVQSFVDSEAHASGRLHSRPIVAQDLRRLRAAGITNLNLDLIAGLAGQTFASWEESLAALVECDVPHASVYMFEVDEDSRLGREMLSGGARYHAGLVPTDDAMAQMYERAIERLAETGLAQYEISNFCRPGFHSRHNLRYWERRPYLGVGLDASSALYSAHEDPQGKNSVTSGQDPTSNCKTPASKGHDFARKSFVSGHDSTSSGKAPISKGNDSTSKGFVPEYDSTSRGFVSGHDFSRAENAEKMTGALAPAEKTRHPQLMRSTTTDDLKAYLSAPQPLETAWLTREQQHEEAWFLGLRLNAGVDVAALKREFGAELLSAAMEQVEQLMHAGLLTFDGDRVCLTARGRLISNDVFQEFLELTPQAAKQIA